MTTVIDVADLRKRVRRRPALDGLTMQVEAGHVHGLLGPSGSGKSTAVRVLLGLARPDGGRVTVLGHALPGGAAGLAGRVGAATASPALLGDLSGRRTLHRLADAAGAPRGRADPFLDEFGLTARADDPVRTYSPGLRQRLVLAAALLGPPELLILDDPFRELDPAGTALLQDRLRSLAEAGTTSVVATTQVALAEPVCDAVTIVDNGRRVAGGPLAAVLADHDRGEFRVRVSDQDRAVAIIAETGLPVTPHRDHFVVGDLADAAWLSRTLGRHGLWVHELTPLAPGLERVVRELTGQPPPALPRPAEPVPQPVPAGGPTADPAEPA